MTSTSTLQIIKKYINKKIVPFNSTVQYTYNIYIHTVHVYGIFGKIGMNGIQITKGALHDGGPPSW